MGSGELKLLMSYSWNCMKVFAPQNRFYQFGRSKRFEKEQGNSHKDGCLTVYCIGRSVDRNELFLYVKLDRQYRIQNSINKPQIVHEDK